MNVAENVKKHSSSKVPIWLRWSQSVLVMKLNDQPRQPQRSIHFENEHVSKISKSNFIWLTHTYSISDPVKSSYFKILVELRPFDEYNNWVFLLHKVMYLFPNDKCFMVLGLNFGHNAGKAFKWKSKESVAWKVWVHWVRVVHVLTYAQIKNSSSHHLLSIKTIFSYLKYEHIRFRKDMYCQSNLFPAILS